MTVMDMENLYDKEIRLFSYKRNLRLMLHLVRKKKCKTNVMNNCRHNKEILVVHKKKKKAQLQGPGSLMLKGIVH